MKFSIKDFFSKCDQFHRKLHFFYAVYVRHLTLFEIIVFHQVWIEISLKQCFFKQEKFPHYVCGLHVNCLGCFIINFKRRQPYQSSCFMFLLAIKQIRPQSHHLRFDCNIYRGLCCAHVSFFSLKRYLSQWVILTHFSTVFRFI